MSQRYKFWTIIIIAFTIWGALFIYNNQKDPDARHKFKLGLDLSGGSYLVYRADTSQIASADVASSMAALRDAIERRINAFGVSEPVVQVESGGKVGGVKENRLIVELPGVTDLNEATKRIGQTPVLEFRLLKESTKKQLEENKVDLSTIDPMQIFSETGLTGALLKKATVQYDQQLGNRPIVGLQFNDEGADLFAKITRENKGDTLGIFLDGTLLQAPTINEEITGGEAIITGSFSRDEVSRIVRDLNYGSLPVPVSLISSQTIGASLGSVAVSESVKAGFYGFIAVVTFLLIIYRFYGLVAAIALCTYTVINLLIFLFLPITFTAASIAGFVLSVGMAVDANILIFERTKEELRRGKKHGEALAEGFHRAWSSIRDSNLSSIITAIILYYFASTSVVKGFALVFFIGVVVSMFSAVTATRTILYALNKSEK